MVLFKKLEVNIYNIVTSEQMDIWGHSVSSSFSCCVLSLLLARRIWSYSQSSVSSAGAELSEFRMVGAWESLGFLLGGRPSEGQG